MTLGIILGWVLGWISVAFRDEFYDLGWILGLDLGWILLDVCSFQPGLGPWHTMFYITAGLLGLELLIFTFFASATEQQWNNPENLEKNSPVDEEKAEEMQKLKSQEWQKILFKVQFVLNCHTICKKKLKYNQPSKAPFGFVHNSASSYIDLTIIYEVLVSPSGPICTRAR